MVTLALWKMEVSTTITRLQNGPEKSLCNAGVKVRGNVLESVDRVVDLAITGRVTNCVTGYSRG